MSGKEHSKAVTKRPNERNYVIPDIALGAPRIRDPRDIPEDLRYEYGWVNVKPCELRPIFPSDTYLDKCANKLWRDGENLWYGTMKNKFLETKVFDNPYDRIAYFFKLGYHRSLDADYEAPYGTPELPHVSIENIAKMLWLCDEFLDSDLTYDNPMCAHYDSDAMDNVIHPGGMRKCLLKMYCPDDHEIELFYFNTGGFYHAESMENLRIVTRDEASELCFNGEAVTGCLTADHGTIIPHLMVGSKVIFNRQDEYFRRCMNNLQRPDFNIYINLDYPYDNHSYLDFLTSNPLDAKVIVEVKQVRNTDFELKRVLVLSIVHGLLLRPYEDDTIKITING